MEKNKHSQEHTVNSKAMDSQINWPYRFSKEKLETRQYRLFSAINEVFYKWEGTAWVMVEDATIIAEGRTYLEEKIGEPSTKQNIECMWALRQALHQNKDYLQNTETSSSIFDSQIVIPCRNKYLMLDRFSIKTINPILSYNLTYAIDLEIKDKDFNLLSNSYDKSTFKTFIEECIPDEYTRKAVQQYIGYSLINSNDLKIAQMWVGASRSKNILLEIISKLHQHVRIYDPLINKEFRFSNILDATLLLVNISSKNKLNTDEMKMLINGETLSVNQKYKNIHYYRNKAKLFFIAESLPKDIAEHNSFWDQVQIIEFEDTRTYKDDYLLEAKLSSELMLILMWAIQGLQDIIINKEIQFTDKMRESKIRLRDEDADFMAWWNNSGLCFSSGRKKTPDEFSTKADIYKMYDDWCFSRGVEKKQFSYANFYKQLLLVAQKSKCKLIYHRVVFTRGGNTLHAVNIVAMPK